MATTTTTKPATEHTIVVEIETESGYRYWSAPMPESELSDFLATTGGGLSEVSCSISCEMC